MSTLRPVLWDEDRDRMVYRRQTGGFGVVPSPIFRASGQYHSAGLVPDPGSSAGSTRYLCEDGTFSTPAGGLGGSSDHATLSHLAWGATGHVSAGVVGARLAAFDASFAAVYYSLSGSGTVVALATGASMTSTTIDGLMLSTDASWADQAANPTTAGHMQRNGADLVFHDGTAARRLVKSNRTISTTSPLTGGGALSGDLTLGITLPAAATSAHYDPSVEPGNTLVTPSQEFTTAQAAGGWTNTFDPGGVLGTPAIGPAGLELPSTSSGAVSLAGRYHSTFPTGDFAVMAKLRLWGSGTAAAVGLALMQGTGSTDDIYFAGLYQTAYGPGIANYWVNYCSAYNALGGDRVYIAGPGVPIYVLMRYDSTNHKVTTFMGIDPESLKVADLDFTLTNAATKIGILINRPSGAARYTRGTAEWVRVIADTYTSSATQVPPRLSGAFVAGS